MEHCCARLQSPPPAGPTAGAFVGLKAGGREAPLGRDVPVVDLAHEDLAPAEAARPLAERLDHAPPHMARPQVFLAYDDGEVIRAERDVADRSPTALRALVTYLDVPELAVLRLGCHVSRAAVCSR